MSTIKDVATLAGVSTATVSNYINGTHPVSPDTGRRIQSAIDSLHYAINLNAKVLKTKQNREVCIILPNLNDAYYNQIYQGIKSCFEGNSYELRLELTNDIPESEEIITKELTSLSVAGLILVTCKPDSFEYYYENFLRKNIPIVLIDRNITDIDASFVTFNMRSMTSELTRLALNRQDSCPALIAGSRRYTCEEEAYRGYQDACRDYKISEDQQIRIESEMTKEDAFRATVSLFQTKRPSSIITTSELMASGVIEAMRCLGRSLADIPVYSLGEEHWNIYTSIPTTQSIPRPAIKLGKTAARILLDHLLSPRTKESERIVLDGGHIFSRVHVEETKEPEPVTLRALLLDTPQVHYMLGLIQNFTKRTGIEVKAQLLPHRNLYRKIISLQKSSDDHPFDIIMYDIPWLKSLASTKVLADITDNIDQINQHRFFKDIFNYYSLWKSRYYGIPFMYAPQILYYHPEIFNDTAVREEYHKLNSLSLRPPRTLREFTTVADFFTNRTDAVPYGISIPAAYSECLCPEIYMRLYSYDCSLFDRRGNVCLDTPEATSAYVNFVRSVHSAKPNFMEATDNSVVDEFLAGETAMLITYPSFLKDIVNLRQNDIVGAIGYSTIPGKHPLLGGWGLGISSESVHKDQAMRFLTWTTGEQFANYMTMLGGCSTISSTYSNDELVSLYPWLPLYYDMYKYSKPTLPPALENNTVIPQDLIDDIVYKWIIKLLNEELPISETITNTHQELEELVAHFREMKN